MAKIKRDLRSRTPTEFAKRLAKRFPIFSQQSERTGFEQENNIRSQKRMSRAAIVDAMDGLDLEQGKRRQIIQLSKLLSEKVCAKNFITGLFLKDSIRFSSEEIKLAKQIGVGAIAGLEDNLLGSANSLIFQRVRAGREVPTELHILAKGTFNAHALVQALSKAAFSQS